MTFVGLLFGAVLASCRPAGGTTFVVNNNGDGHDIRPGDGVCNARVGKTDCTLRAALEESNARPGANTIQFNLPTSPLGSTTISPATPLPEILDEVVIDGATQPGYDGGKPVVVLQGDLEPEGVRGLVVAEGKTATIKAMQVLRFYEAGVENRGGTLTLIRMELAGNKGSGLDNGSSAAFSTTTIQNTAITENEAAGISGSATNLTIQGGAVGYNKGGGVRLDGAQLAMAGTSVLWNSTAYDGGGLMLSNTGTINLVEVTIEGNAAHGNGGGIFLEFATAMMTIQGSVIQDNQAANGGGIYIARGTARLSATSVVGNRATHDGGGVYTDDFSSPDLGVTNSLYLEHGTGIGLIGHGNIADSDSDGLGRGGGIYSRGVFDMAGSWIEGNTGDGLLNDYGTIQIQDSIIQDNTFCGVNSFTSGVTHSVYILRTTVRRNQTCGMETLNANLDFSEGTVEDNSGIGIIAAGGTLVVTNSTISGNHSPWASVGGGGGIQAANIISGEISNSTISGNSTGVNGGGIWLSGLSDTILTLKNVTISGNAAGTTGGGLDVSYGSVVLKNVTIAGNSAPDAGGLHRNAAATVTMTNSLLDGNSGGNCGGPLTSLGHNLDSDSSCRLAGTGDLSRVSARLGPLADNGGPTQTRALLPGSPAIDAGGDSTCLPNDQRGVSRPQGVHSDIGAYELETTSTAVTPTPTATASRINFEPVTFSTDRIFQGGQSCGCREVTIRVRVSDPQTVKSMVLYFRLEKKDGSKSTDWSSPRSMFPQGDGWYQAVLSANELPNIAGWQTDAWLVVHFVASGEGGIPIAWSFFYRQVTVTLCGN